MNLSGQKLGKYELTHRLGQGGMAQVYTAIQPTIDRRVAIKVMHSYLTETENFITRFKREAKALGQLSHPHIVQVIDFDHDLRLDIYYMVMDYIGGGDLSRYLRERRILSSREALTIAGQLASALDHAHRLGMIHRDLKPSNVLFRDDTHTHAILTDFGITHLLQDKRLTESGAMPGTPAYISPEAVQGKRVDGRADLYSLGIMIYEMVTGVMPFDGDTSIIVMLKHVQEPIPDIATEYPHLPPAVIELIETLLAKSPDDRYQNAAELRYEIDRIIPTLPEDPPIIPNWIDIPVEVPPSQFFPVDPPTATNDGLLSNPLGIQQSQVTNMQPAFEPDKEISPMFVTPYTELHPSTGSSTHETTVDPHPMPQKKAGWPAWIWAVAAIGLLIPLAIVTFLFFPFPTEISVAETGGLPPTEVINNPPLLGDDDSGGRILDIDKPDPHDFKPGPAERYLSSAFEGDLDALSEENPGSTMLVSFHADGDLYVATVGETPSMVNLTEEMIDTIPNYRYGEYQWVNFSGNGQYAVMGLNFETEECAFEVCLAVSESNLGRITPVRIDDGFDSLIHPLGRASITGNGQVIVYESDGGTHERDIFVTWRKQDSTTWTTPTLLTAESDFEYHTNPSLSLGGEYVVFECGDSDRLEQTSICKFELEGEMQPVELIVPFDGHPASDALSYVRHPQMSPEETLIFETDWGGYVRIWEYSENDSRPGFGKILNPNYVGDYSPCLMPSGEVISMWEGDPEIGARPELKWMSPNGDRFYILSDELGSLDIEWVNCGGFN